MRRLRLKLVALTSLVAYLLANTSAGVAMESWMRTLATKPAQTTCEHCQQCHDEEEPQPAGDAPCPCCPEQKPGCPCPGGCVLCSVAKAPCFTPFALPIETSPSCDECLGEVATLLVSPFLSGLIRPPRA